MRVGVFPGSMLDRNQELFEALELAFPVRFEARIGGETRDLDAALVLDGRIDSLTCPRFVVDQAIAPESTGDRHAEVRFSSSPQLDRPLREAILHDARAESVGPLVPEPGEEVMAEGPDGPLWTRKGEGAKQVQRVALSPAQSDSSLPLRAQLRAGRFLSLLPLASFLGRTDQTTAMASAPTPRELRHR